MKKTLIAVLCVIPLCLTSCASAPEEVPQEAQPQIEAEVTTDTPEAEINGNSEDITEDNSDEQVSVEEKNEETEKTEQFPEPEAFIEPEVITLEPADDIMPSENESVSEEVEKEEPPEIISEIISENENNTAEIENQSDNAITAEESQDKTDDTIADTVIEEKSSYSDSEDVTGGIDITDDESDSKTQLLEEEKHIIPSRSVTLKKFEYLDVTYPGTGWIYMGLTDNSKDLAYFGRKLGTKDTKFSLQARAAGTKIIHFYKNDPLTGQYLDDYIEVIISSENGSNKTHIEAPEYKLPVQKKEKQAGTTTEEIAVSEENNTPSTSAATSTSSSTEETESPATTEAKTTSEAKQISGTTSVTTAKSTAADISTAGVKSTTTEKSTDAEASASETKSETAVSSQTAASASSNPVSLLQEAQLLYNEKEYKAALSKLNSFFEVSTDNRDEALYLKGQILEAKSDIRDIKGAMEAYTTLTKNYPASSFWDSANKRIIYLKRFYLEVR